MLIPSPSLSSSSVMLSAVSCWLTTTKATAEHHSLTHSGLVLGLQRGEKWNEVTWLRSDRNRQRDRESEWVIKRGNQIENTSTERRGMCQSNSKTLPTTRPIRLLGNCSACPPIRATTWIDGEPVRTVESICAYLDAYNLCLQAIAWAFTRLAFLKNRVCNLLLVDGCKADSNENY